MVIGLFGALVLAMAVPAAALIGVTAAVLVLDGDLLRLVARRRTGKAAVSCAVVAGLAAVLQAAWAWISFGWEVLPPEADAVTWLGLELAPVMSAGVVLLVRHRSRPWGWAVLMGSAQGFVSSFLVLMAALMAAIGAD